MAGRRSGKDGTPKDPTPPPSRRAAVAKARSAQRPAPTTPGAAAAAASTNSPAATPAPGTTGSPAPARRAKGTDTSQKARAATGTAATAAAAAGTGGTSLAASAGLAAAKKAVGRRASTSRPNTKGRVAAAAAGSASAAKAAAQDPNLPPEQRQAAIKRQRQEQARKATIRTVKIALVGPLAGLLAFLLIGGLIVMGLAAMLGSMTGATSGAIAGCDTQNVRAAGGNSQPIVTSAGTTPGAWVAPTEPGFTITTHFGDNGSRWSPSGHNGIDFTTADPAAALGKPVFALAAGTVIPANAEEKTWAGEHAVKIDHDNGLATLYGHLASHVVNPGDVVKPGATIGTVGDLGATNGPRLHISVLSNGVAIDPEKFLTSRGVILDPANSKPADTADDKAPSDKPADDKAGVGREGAVPAVAGPMQASNECSPCPGSGFAPYSAPGAATPAADTEALVLPTGRKLTPEEVANAATIIARGQAAGLPPEAQAIAIATSLVETELRNLNGGDRDSLGLFQQRPSSGWGTPAEIMDPAKAADAFYGVATHTNNTGLTDIPWQTMAFGDAAQKVQRSAFPDKYGKREAEAKFIVSNVSGATFATVAACGGAIINAGSITGPCPLARPAVEAQVLRALDPNTANTIRCVSASFPQIETFGTIRGSSISGDHETGRAIDIMVTAPSLGGWSSPTAKNYGDQIAAFLQANAQTLNVKYVIWRQRIWNVERADEGWRPMEDRGSPTANHMDHPHVSLYPTVA